MNTNIITPPQTEEALPYKVPFKVFGNFAMIDALSRKGVVIRVDAQQRYACACFDNLIDFNDFRSFLKRVEHSKSVTA